MIFAIFSDVIYVDITLFNLTEKKHYAYFRCIYSITIHMREQKYIIHVVWTKFSVLSYLFERLAFAKNCRIERESFQ